MRALAEQLDLFNPAGARAARDEGLARVDDNSDDWEWRDQVDAAIARYAAAGFGFTSDDIRAVVTGQPHHDNAWGARFAAASRLGLIVKTGNYRQSARVPGHARAIAVWRGTHKGAA